MRVPRLLLLLGALTLLAALLPGSALADGKAAAAARPKVDSTTFERAQVAPMVALLESIPHGSELARLKLYVGTDAEIVNRCGAGTMACYDPISERMVVSGERDEVAGISREAVIAHEYGHHIANNRAGGIWTAFAAGTLRWSTYERVCESKRAGEAFPGNESEHYWANPGEAFAQAYSQLVIPSEEWHYSPLFRPDRTALRLLREDVVDPVAPRQLSWSVGAPAGAGRAIALATALPADGRYSRTLRVPYDGRIRVRVHGEDGARVRASLLDPESGAVLVAAGPGAGGVTHLRFADCGHRILRLEVSPLGTPAPFRVDLLSP